MTWTAPPNPMTPFAERTARNGFHAAATFAVVVLIVHLVGGAVEALGLNVDPRIALGQCGVLLAMAVGVRRGGFGWAGLVALVAALVPLAAVGVWVMASHGLVDTPTLALWTVYAVAGLAAALALTRTSRLLWRLRR